MFNNTKLRDAMVYICTNYPYPEELSKSRLTKMVYLADWRSVLQRGQSMTGIEWLYNHYGPYVPAVEELARRSGDFEVRKTTNAYGAVKELISLTPEADPITTSLEHGDIEILDYVIEETESLNFTDFVGLVYSTYPIRTAEKYSALDLIRAAKQFREESTIHTSPTT